MVPSLPIGIQRNSATLRTTEPRHRREIHPWDTRAPAWSSFPTLGLCFQVAGQVGREREVDIFLRRLKFLNRDGAARLQVLDHLLHQYLGRRGPGGDANHANTFKPAFLNVAVVIDQVGLRTRLLGFLHQPVGVRTVGRADNENEACVLRHGLN